MWLRPNLMANDIVLSSALNNTKEPLATVRALRQVNYERLQRELLEWQQIASRRSGARGLKARQHLIVMEEKVEMAKSLCVLLFGFRKSTYSQYLTLTFRFITQDRAN